MVQHRASHQQQQQQKNKKDSSTRNFSYVYVRSENHGWEPAIQLHSNDGGGGSDGKKTVQVKKPIFQTEQQMLQCSGRVSGAARTAMQKYSKEQSIPLRDYDNNLLPLQNVDSNGNLEEYEDMVELPFVHEAAILYNLKKRHITSKPYTRTGDILIAVNPYQWFHDMYNDRTKIRYSKTLVWNAKTAASSDDPRNRLAPHVYEVSALAYKGLASHGEDQSILVSGESGAGKTETVKICLNHIASTQCVDGSAHSASNDPVVQRIVESHPLLEAFGNAKTRRNDNSSRFGKYLKLQFRTNKKRSSWKLVGSKCDFYLLEKNRVVSHDDEERTYHIFYQLLAAPDKVKSKFWDKLSGKGARSFSYVGYSTCNAIEGTTDADKFLETMEALRIVDVQGPRLVTLMRAICVVMQLGNLGFGASTVDSDHSVVTTTKELQDLAGLMGVSNEDLVAALTERTFTTHRETHKVPLNAEAAKEACNALAKEVYQRIFGWLVGRVDAATAVEDDGDVKHGLIGLLDIFGFEIFSVNRFEQLCINYANEKLQQKFTEDVFLSVQREYETEGIPLTDIHFDDNSDVLNLIEGRTGLLALLNEECVRPGGNDFEFVQKALQQNKNVSCFTPTRTDRMSFAIQHYAGKVTYDGDSFVARNQDTLPTDLQQCAEKSSNEIVKMKRTEPATKEKETSQTRIPHGRPGCGESNILAPTVWTKYRNQLSTLMKCLRETQSRYIRCIKPNSNKSPALMEHWPVIKQLQCAGVIAGITITRSTFPNRLDNTLVLARYALQLDSCSPWKPVNIHNCSPPEKSEACQRLLGILLCKQREVGPSGKLINAFVVGKTKTYFRAGALEWLEQNRRLRLDDPAVVIQRWVRGWLVRFQRVAIARRKKAEAKEEERRLGEQREKLKREQQRIAARRAAAREAELKTARDRVSSAKQWLRNIETESRENACDLNRKIAEARDKVDQLRDEVARLEIERESCPQSKKTLRARQQMKLKEAKRLITYLKTEHDRVRKEHNKVLKAYEKVKKGCEVLSDCCDNISVEFEDLHLDTVEVHTTCEETQKRLRQAQNDNAELRSKVLKRHDQYMRTAESRLELQKKMAKVVDLIQNRCTDPDIIEEVVVVAFQCEGDAKSYVAAVEMETSLPSLACTETSESSSSSLGFD